MYANKVVAMAVVVVVWVHMKTLNVLKYFCLQISLKTQISFDFFDFGNGVVRNGSKFQLNAEIQISIEFLVIQFHHGHSFYSYNAADCSLQLNAGLFSLNGILIDLLSKSNRKKCPQEITTVE